MDSKNSKGQSIALAVVALLAGILIGIVGASAFNMEEPAVTRTEDEQTDITNAAIELRVTTNRLFVEHTELTAAALRNVFENSNDTAAALAALDENSNELAAVIGSFYDDQTEEEFLDIWKSHIDSLSSYAEAAREGDQASMEQAESELGAYANEISTFLNEAADMPKESLEDDFGEHAGQMLQIVNSYAGGNYEESFRVQRAAVSHMGALADNISAAIVEKFPEQF